MAEDRAGGDGNVKPPAACPDLGAEGTEDHAEDEGDVEPPAAHLELGTEAEQAPGNIHASKPASPQPDPPATDPALGFTRTFPNVKEFLAFTKAKI